MPGDETLTKRAADDEDSEDEDEDVVESIPTIDIDVTKLTPLSPEVISKQVRVFFMNAIAETHRCRRR